MVATAATASFFPVSSPNSESVKSSGKHVSGLGSVDVRGVKTKSLRGLEVKVNAQAPTKVNDHNRISDNPTSGGPRTFINKLPDWSVLLAALTTIFLAAEKQWMMLDWKIKRSDMIKDLDPFGVGRVLEDGLVFRQNFSIRSYEIGPDRTASIETLMNHFQETTVNHLKHTGLLGGGFVSNSEMAKRNLLWAVTKMQVLVDRYPTWGDMVQVDTWVAASGKNTMRRDWLVRDYKTGEILIRASSNWVMMNKVTRRLSKFPDELRAKIQQYSVNTPPLVDDDNSKLPKLDENAADHVCNGLTTKWSDLDLNQHVNNVKYVGWVLESAPEAILENQELASMTLEYRRECMKDTVLQSLTSLMGNNNNHEDHVDCQHLLRIEGGGGVIVQGRTKWRPKYGNRLKRNIGSG